MGQKKKKANPLHPQKHYYRRFGVRPCNARCPFHVECDLKPKHGYPCPIELREVTEFATKLVQALGLGGDPVAWALAEVAAVQRIRIKRMSAFLTGQPDGSWAKTLARFLEDLLKAEKEYRETLRQLKAMSHGRIEIDLDELVTLDIEDTGTETETA